MIGYLGHRALHSLIVLSVMSFVIYGLMGLMPGDPIDLMISADPKLTSEDAIRLRELYGLDKSIMERYGNWLGAAVSGDFGYSRLFAKPVLDVLFPALANTVVLIGIAIGLSLLIGLPAGLIAALKPYSKLDYSINLLAFGGISMPAFWLALLLIILFAVTWGVLPAGGTGELAAGGAWTKLQFLVLPVMTLTIASVGGHTRYMRAAMLETLRQDYIRTAKAKGAGQVRIVLVHALRNAMIPVVTIIALDFGFLFSGALVTETVFAYPGMGKLIFDSIMGNDFNLALVALLLATGVTLIGNLLADLAYAWLDPRISYR
ncbi:MAG: ABC transporter permease [Rhodospirillaceae bacterium]|jgi:peptide/nickel transport system permease protein|nr:ABC transporter permease [Rhodospirillales bacterium]MBT3906057.1 ABC transporter permease [Rhodospirillaceae bacterium]MBT5036075.1 ABC transporter permease [Rhodospirillaceae bacterium]MBT6220541.1 ABC transporter permease [Rhodospirillaceae bacterium]MBT6362620.1 ABC transporter permease [Rhodospirillaceae bacterium]